MSRSVYAGVFLLSASIIVLQVALTRVFAIMMWHHLTYMVVSIALLGFGAAGSILTMQRSALRRDSPSDALARYAVGYGGSAIIAFALLRGIEIDSFALWSDKTNLLRLMLVYLLATVPFLLGGMALGLALTRFAREVHRIYFVDLLGSGAGGAASVFMLQSLGGSGTVVLAATVGLLAAVCFALSASRRLRVAALAAAAGGFVVTMVVSGIGASVGLPHWPLNPPFAAGKEFYGKADDPDLQRIFSATAEVEVGPSGPAMTLIGGDIGYSAMQPITARSVAQDGTAPTMLIEHAGDLQRFPFINATQTASAHVAFDARGGSDADVLVIGVGGGVDVMVSLASGARSVTAVEINTAMIEMVTDRFADYTAGLLQPGAHEYSDRVRLINGEGRSYMRSHDERYDIIQMSGVDSFTALSTGAYTLAESYLYTTDAVAEFYAHLQEGGYINYSRFLLAYPRLPRETLRLANVAAEALAAMGIEQPSAQILVFQGRGWASTMIKRGRFTAVEVAALKAFAAHEGFLGLLYDPLRSPDDAPAPEIEQIEVADRLDDLITLAMQQQLPAASPALREVVHRHLTTGFAAVSRGDVAGARAAIAAIVADAPQRQRPAVEKAVTGILGELYAVSTAPVQNFPKTAAFFGRLLNGSPAERQAFVDGYPYDISACGDDAPFFFNYYRYSGLGALFGAASTVDGLAYHTDFPVGHMVLIASLVQITLLALLLIFWPLRKLAGYGLQTTGRWRYFAYFAALGGGFMCVEIVLMQKLVIFLGHPTYAVSVVLASLLAFAGCGSLLAGRMKSISRGRLRLLAASIVALLLLETALLNWVLPEFLGWSLPARVIIAVLAIMPLGIGLGVPFPTGIRIVEHNCPQLVPWCWAINGFLSVFSAVFVIVLSMAIGFSAVLLGAALIYTLGIAAMPERRATW